MAERPRLCRTCKLPEEMRPWRKQCKKCEALSRSQRRALASPKSTSDDTRYYVVVNDVHVPHHDRKAVASVLEYVKDLKPHGIIFNGDILDFYEISSYNTNSLSKLEGRRFKETWDTANQFLDDFQKAAGSRLTEQHFIDGNHEDRLARWLAKDSNGVFDGDPAFSISERLRFKQRGIQYHTPYDSAYVKLGHLVVTHGRYSNKYAAAKHLDTYRHSVLIGHTHTPQVFFGPGLLHPQVCYISGHLADVNSPAMDYAPRPNAWVHGFATVAVRKSGNFSVQLHTLWDGRFNVGGYAYGG